MWLRVVSCSLLVILVSGCFSPSPADLEPAASTEEPPPESTRTLQVEHSAEGGEWLLLWAPFVRHGDPYRILGEERFVTSETGDPNLAFLAPLDSVWVGENETLWGGRGSGSIGVRASENAITRNINYQTTFYNFKNLSGLFAFYSANVAWTLHLDITLEQALLLEPQIFTGEGSSFAYGGEQEYGIRLPVGEVELNTTSNEPGWTHIEFLYERFQPRSEREIEVRFADGFEIVDETSTSGQCLVIVCQGGSSGPGEQFGVINNTMGENLARATYQEAGYGLDIAIVHLPGAEQAFPTEFNVQNYERWAWPFTGFGLPPPEDMEINPKTFAT